MTNDRTSAVQWDVWDVTRDPPARIYVAGRLSEEEARCIAHAFTGRYRELDPMRPEQRFEARQRPPTATPCPECQTDWKAYYVDPVSGRCCHCDGTCLDPYKIPPGPGDFSPEEEAAKLSLIHGCRPEAHERWTLSAFGAIRRAYAAGAEAMRERAARQCEEAGAESREGVAALIRALPLTRTP